MIEIKQSNNNDWKYVIQTPEEINSSTRLVLCLHGSLTGDYEECVEEIHQEYINGRWRFNDDIAKNAIYLTPVIPRLNDEQKLSNGLEVDPQSMFRGSIHQLCHKEYPDMYSPHLKVKDVIEEVLSKYSEVNMKVMIVGISAGGAFASRFAFIFPGLVDAYISFLSVDLVLPLESADDLVLPFPFGLGELEDCPDIHINRGSFGEYFEIPKLFLIDTDDDRVNERDSLYWEIDKSFYDMYSKRYGVKPYERASALVAATVRDYNDNAELVITSGNGHSVKDDEFDSFIIKYLHKIY